MKQFFFALALIVSVVVGWYALAKQKNLEFNDVFQFHLQVNPETKVPESISGISGASMYCVSKIEAKNNRGILTIFVYIGACGKGDSGSFYYPVKIDDDVKELRFGRKGYLLWRRNGVRQ